MGNKSKISAGSKKIHAIWALGLVIVSSWLIGPGAFLIPAYAAIKNLEVSVDTDNIGSWTPGVAFFPEIEIDDEDDDGELELSVDTSDIENAMDPTRSVSLSFTIEADDDDALDEDLKVKGNAIRSSYVDYVDGGSASGRFLVYPFYQLTEPEARIDLDSEVVSWSSVDFAGEYELVITYETAGGSEKTVRYKVDGTEKDISGYVKYAENGLGAAVRALATDDDYFLADVDYSSREASWEYISGVEKYKVSITYTNSKGTEMKKTREVTGCSLDVSSYISASDDGTITVRVRGLPTSDESKYYNIAPSEWSEAEGSTCTADTSDYETDYVWNLLGDYTSVTDGSFASATASYKSSASSYAALTGATGTGSDENWVRDGYKWQYLVDGSAFKGGWKEINGAWYYFDEDGYMHTGWLELDGRYYYLTSRIGDTCGQMLTGTNEINGKTYIFDSSGVCTNR